MNQTIPEQQENADVKKSLVALRTGFLLSLFFVVEALVTSACILYAVGVLGLSIPVTVATVGATLLLCATLLPLKRVAPLSTVLMEKEYPNFSVT